MAELLRVPEVAAGASEAILSEWLVPAGTAFSQGDPIAVIETEKAVVEVEAEVDAVILRALVEGGSTVEVGAPMALLGTPDEARGDIDAILADLGVGEIVATPAAPRREIPETEIEPKPLPARSRDAPAEHRGGGRIFISPIARRLLRDAGIDPVDVAGSGPGGRIVRRDVESALRTQIPAQGVSAVPDAAPTLAAVGAFRDEPHTRVRRAIAKRLTRSKQEVPHFYVRRTVRLDPLLEVRQQLNEHAPVRISVNDMLIRGIAVAHQRLPEANVIWTDDALRYFDRVDIAVAVASDRGLVAPVLRDVGQQSLSAISANVKALVDQANSGSLQQRDLEGGSISISNLGMFGVDEFSAIINPPQSAILAVGAGLPRSVVVDGELAVATCMEMVLSVDHRAIDGSLAARWMETLVTALEHPMKLLV